MRTRKQPRIAAKLYPLTVGFYADCPDGRVTIERRGLNRKHVDAFWRGAEKVLKQAGLLQVFEHPKTRKKVRK